MPIVVCEETRRVTIVIAVAAVLLQGCATSVDSERTAALRVLKENAHLLPGPETESAADAFSTADLALMREQIAAVSPVVLRALKDGNHGYAHLALALGLAEAVPQMRENLLGDRYFYGWEGPDYSTEEAYLRDEQHTHHLVYIKAISGLTGRPIAEAVELTENEVRALESEGRKASLDPDNVQKERYFCAKWLLIRLRKTQEKRDN